MWLCILHEILHTTKYDCNCSVTQYDKDYVERVLKFAERMALQDVLGHKPRLVIIQNFCSPSSVKGKEEFEIPNSTEVFRSTLRTVNIEGTNIFICKLFTTN